jgi:hypothetical protein
MVTELRNRHAAGDTAAGINVRKGAITNILEENVVVPCLVYTSAISLATECVRLILKIDDIVRCSLAHARAPPCRHATRAHRASDGRGAHTRLARRRRARGGAETDARVSRWLAHAGCIAFASLAKHPALAARRTSPDRSALPDTRHCCVAPRHLRSAQVVTR